MEDTAKRAAFINSLSVIGKEKEIENYIENIKKVNVGDVKRVVENYFINDVSIVLQPK
jgi:predicted Zn-dependent peptidase